VREEPSWFIVPYVSYYFQKKFNRLNSDIRISFHNVNKLREFIKMLKIRFRIIECHKICCKDCDANYMDRRLKTKIVEHTNHIRWNTTLRHNSSPIAGIRLGKHCNFEWNISERDCFRKYCISESKRILNLQTDMEGLPKKKAYFMIDEQ